MNISIRNLTWQIDSIVWYVWQEKTGQCAKRASLLGRFLADHGTDACVLAGAAQVFAMGSNVTNGTIYTSGEDVDGVITPNHKCGYHAVVQAGDMLIDITTIEYADMPIYLMYDYTDAQTWKYGYKFTPDADITATVRYLFDRGDESDNFNTAYDLLMQEYIRAAA